uniref:Riboflavin biosynthesis protein n=1 Tax=Prevotella sp. GTC17253 TaxID=3236793 RepID=A0AB33IQJ3_9BACT
MSKIEIIGHQVKPLLPSVATVGFFDGVHLGHRFLIEQLRAEAARRGMLSMVITFARHPRAVLQNDYVPQQLTQHERKLELLEQAGADCVVVLDFDREMAGLTAREFMNQVLREQLGVGCLLTGYDNRFGHNRTEGFDDYVGYGRELGMDVVRSRAFVLEGVNVSSSVIRSQLQEGEIELANRCLGYRYSIGGRVVHGFQEGRKLGYPTANIDVEGSDQLVPAMGVYAVRVRVEGDSATYGGMMSIGTRPTYNGTDRTQEVYIFDFDGDIYGRRVEVEFIRRTRSEERYDNIRQLVERLKQDEVEIRTILRV